MFIIYIRFFLINGIKNYYFWDLCFEKKLSNNLLIAYQNKRLKTIVVTEF